MWAIQYKRRRYLEHLSVEDLVARGKDVMTNLAILTEDMLIGFQPPDKTGELWMILWADVCTEHQLRGYKYPEALQRSFVDAQLPKLDWPGVPEAIRKFRSMGLKETSYSVKFGHFKFLEGTLKKGIIRIAPASSYDDSSLNPAQKDLELELTYMGLPHEVEIDVFDGKTGKPKGKIKPVGNVQFTERSKTDYYVYCLSATFDYRLFGDFEYDCALVIKDPEKFLERLLFKFKEQFPGYTAAAHVIDYIDPLNFKSNKFSVFFSKHFRFWYQKECRAVWIPPTSVDMLEPIFLELGSLEDICEIICLPACPPPA